MENKALITQLVSAGLLGEDAGRKLLQEASLTARPVEDLIYERRAVPEDALLRLKSQLLGVPFKTVDPESIGDNLLKLIPEEMVRNYKVVPLEARDDLFVAGMVNPDDEKAQEALRFVGKQHKVNLGIYLIPMSLWEFVLRKYSPYRSEVEAAVRSLSAAASKKVSFEQKIVSIEGGTATG